MDYSSVWRWLHTFAIHEYLPGEDDTCTFIFLIITNQFVYRIIDILLIISFKKQCNLFTFVVVCYIIHTCNSWINNYLPFFYMYYQSHKCFSYTLFLYLLGGHEMFIGLSLHQLPTTYICFLKAVKIGGYVHGRLLHY